MQVINIIVSDCETGIISIDSFGVLDDIDKHKTVEQAEELYVEKCTTIKYGNKETREKIIANGVFDYSDIDDFTDEVNETIEDGYVEVNGITVSFVWSHIENVQL